MCYLCLRLLTRSSLLCVSGEKVICSPAARNVFRFWTYAPESPFECKYTTRKGKSLRRTIWNWLLSKIERRFTAAREAVACFSRSPRDCFAMQYHECRWRLDPDSEFSVCCRQVR